MVYRQAVAKGVYIHTHTHTFRGDKACEIYVFSLSAQCERGGQGVVFDGVSRRTGRGASIAHVEALKQHLVNIN